MKLLQLFLCAYVFVAVYSTAIIDPRLQRRFLGGGGGGGDTQNVMVSFTQSIQTVIQQINSMNFSSIDEKRTALTNAQQTFTNGAQGTLQTLLNTMGVTFQSFWINNRMIVPNADSGLINTISNIRGVAKIEPEPMVNIQLPFGEVQIVEEDSGNLERVSRQASPQWGVKMIRADQVWSTSEGKGVVVGGIDTGVLYTHETLRSRWRSNYGWYDPYARTSTPNDQNGHGTHTMGTIAGTNGIGVARGATWIACKGCNTNSCTGSALYSCGQWMQCPTKPDGSSKNCGMAPRVVSNSWGGSGGQSWYDDVISSWQTSGIIPVFSIGNSGPNCSTAGSPGDGPNLISVGSTDKDEKISSFSSRGSSTRGNKIKPEISAPGRDVRSAWYTSNSAYATISGTSMACPHVSGVVALMLQKTPGLKYDQIFNAITQNAVTKTLDTSTANSCNGTSTSSYPNNVFGYGRIDALNCVNAV